MKINIIPAVALLLCSVYVQANQPDYTQQIQIDADNLSSVKENVLTYRNNVVVTQGSLQLKADQLEINATAGKGNEVYMHEQLIYTTKKQKLAYPKTDQF